MLRYEPCDTKEAEDEAFDLAAVLALRRVNKLFHQIFSQCNGWAMSGEALRKEYTLKDRRLIDLEDAFAHKHPLGVGPLVCTDPADVPAYHQQWEDRLTDLERRLEHIRRAEFPTVRRRAIADGNELAPLTDSMSETMASLCSL